MTLLVPSPGLHRFTAIISLENNSAASRTITCTAERWFAAFEVFSGQLQDGEYIMDCCDDTLCTPTTTPS